MAERRKSTVVKRAGEPSTWAGLAVLALLARARWPQYAEAIDAGALVLSGGAVALPERRTE